jgi:protein-S-isoprenylcysteine O-methyltransferase Ste14
MTHAAGGAPAYGLWLIAAINAAVSIIFAFSFTKLDTARDWRSFGAFAGFIVALFAEMYGFPLTIYLLAGWLGSAYPALDPFSHDAGHLWWALLGFTGDPHTNVIHLASIALIIGGFWLLATAWQPLHAAQRRGALATDGIYGVIRHPQYVGFVVILLGFLLQWPTLLTVAMFPVLVVMYVRLARAEERAALARHGDVYRDYMGRVPPFLPRWRPAVRRGSPETPARQ